MTQTTIQAALARLAIAPSYESELRDRCALCGVDPGLPILGEEGLWLAQVKAQCLIAERPTPGTANTHNNNLAWQD